MLLIPVGMLFSGAPALGEETKRRQIDIPEPQRKSRGEFRVAELKYRGMGLPNALPLLLDFLDGNTDIKAGIELDRVTLSELNARPPMLLFFAGRRYKLHFDQNEREALHTYLSNGGLLYASSIREGRSGMFYRQVRKLIDELFKLEGGRFSPLHKSHDLFSAYFDFADGPPIPRSTRRLRSGDNLEIFTLRGRTVVILSDLNFSTRWVDVEAESHFRALQFGTNLIVFAMTNRLGGDMK